MNGNNGGLNKILFRLLYNKFNFDIYSPWAKQSFPLALIIADLNLQITE